MSRRGKEGSSLRGDLEDGVSIVESLIAIFILAVAGLAMLSVLGTSLVAERQSRERQRATDAASGELEAARAVSFSALAMRTGQVSVTDPFVDDVAGTLVFAHRTGEAEPLVLTANGSVDPYATTDGPLTVRTFVTWFDPDSIGQQEAKRVTVVVTYDDPRGGHTEVRESTVVAHVNRGLPLPEFSLSPATSSRTAAADQTACFDHVLENRGETDRYDFTVDGGSDFNTHVSHSGWQITATLDGAAMADLTGDLRPDSADFVDRGEEVALQICYDPPDTVSNGEEFAFTAILRSAFDSSVQQTVEDTINVGQPPLVLYLHQEGTKNNRLYPADPTAPVEASLASYDNVDNVEGLTLVIETPVDDRPRWDHQFNEQTGTTLSGHADLTIWSAWADAILQGKTDPKSLYLTFVLEKVNTQQQVTASLGTWTHFYEHTVGDWLEQGPIGLDFTAASAEERTFLENEYLRLTATCDAGQDAVDCHLAFDTTSYPSRLELEP